MSKQLSVSALFAVFAMAAFALSAGAMPRPAHETGATAVAAAPELEVSLPGF